MVGHCVVGAQCSGYAMVVNVPNPAHGNGNGNVIGTSLK